MKPNTNPTDDSLISPMGANPLAQDLNVPAQPVQPQEPAPVTSFTSTQTESSPFSGSNVAYQNPSTLSSTLSTPTGVGSFQSMGSAQEAPTSGVSNFNSPSMSGMDTPPTNQPFQTQPPVTVQPVGQPASQSPGYVSQTSPLDPPPVPPTVGQPIPEATPTTAVVSEKPKKKVPVFLIVLLLLVVVVLAVVGYLAYQNYTLSKNVSTQSETSTPVANTDPYSGYKTYKSVNLPLEFMIPESWVVSESQDPEIANQKMISVSSPDFAYEGSEISSGFEFRVGPVNDLTKKYDSFEAFVAEENADNSYTTREINSQSWLIKNTEAKTLLQKSPMTVALYTNPSFQVNGLQFFTTILNSFKITSPEPTSNITPTTSVTPAPTKAASPSATPATD